MKKEKKPITVINIMKSGRIVEDMSTVTMPVDIYENVMRILLMSKQRREREAEAAIVETATGKITCERKEW